MAIAIAGLRLRRRAPRMAVAATGDAGLLPTHRLLLAARQREHVAVAVEVRRVVLHDSVTQVTAGDADTLVVTGSHGGASVVPYALAVRAWLYVFNDAGIGKDGAGTAALKLLDAEGQAAAAVSHDSARIGEARDAWENGVVSEVNAAARRLGLQRGDRLAAVLQAVA